MTENATSCSKIFSNNPRSKSNRVPKYNMTDIDKMRIRYIMEHDKANFRMSMKSLYGLVIARFYIAEIQNWDEGNSSELLSQGEFPTYGQFVYHCRKIRKELRQDFYTIKKRKSYSLKGKSLKDNRN